MPSIILSNISKPTSLTDNQETTPLSYSEWVSRNIGIAFSDTNLQYSNYLRTFNKNTETRNAEAINKLREDYVSLLQRLQIIFQNDEEFKRYEKLDFDSNTDLSLVIPAYAKKLKDIALFYSKKRQELKNKKLEYNIVGSYDGLSKLLYSNLVSKFTKNERTEFVSENPLITNSPEFSAISQNFSIEIEELYDTNDYYMDQASIDPFTCLFNDLCSRIVTTPLSAKADPIENNYLCNPSDQTVDDLLFNAYSKYLATDVRYISGGYYVENYKTITLPLEQGNNFFYWFSGQTVFDIPEGIYNNIDINSIDWTDAKGGSAFDVADMVFVNTGNAMTQGAWLQDTDYVSVSAVMHATITDGKIFKYPYPEYGTSAVGGSWSGPGLDDTIRKSRKFFPTEENFTATENAVNDLYWTNGSSISTVNSVYLQETTVGQGGYANSRYNNADKVFVTVSNSEKILYSGERQVAWLYDLNQTQIPITQGVNKVYYPIQRYENDSDLFFHFEKGETIPLSSIKVEDSFVGAVAGEYLDTSDLLVRNQSICGPEIEMAWLKGVPVRFFNGIDNKPCDCDPDLAVYYTDWKYTEGAAQVGVSFKCESNNYIRFIWTGESVDINDVRGFTGFAHDETCPYKYADHSVSIADTNFLNASNKDIFEKWKMCSCQAIQHSPFGHNDSNFDKFRISPDFIVKDSYYPNNFNKKTWLGYDKKDYRTSKDIARFYPEIIEKELGWGKGEWKSASNEKFVLEKGQSYIYHRADTNNCSFDSPFFVINEKYGDGLIPNDECVKVPYYPVWMKAVQDIDGKWIDAGVVSDMSLQFGDFITYTHRDSYDDTRRRMLYKGNELTSLSGEYVTLNKTDPNISFVSFTNSVPSVNFLMKIPLSSYSNLWGKGDHGLDINSNKKTSIETSEFRIEFDYLQITQPLPSDIVLSDGSVIEYKFGACNNQCFIWNEDLKFEVYAPVKKWNKIVFDNCVESEILSYLNSQITNCYKRQIRCVTDCDYSGLCGCENYCSPTKSGLTATFVDSDIIFNTELSGIPLFVNYFARNQFNQKVTVHDITDGDKSLLVPVVTGNFVKGDAPWRDLLNQSGSNFVTEESFDNLKNQDEINFYKPSRISMNRYETFDGETTFSPRTTGLGVYRKDNYFDKPFDKKSFKSSYVTEFSLGKNQGRLLTKGRQTFTPYTNTHEKNAKEFYGLYKNPISFTPWDQSTGEWKESDLYINFRNNYNIKCANNWFDDQLVLSDDVWNWQTDIFGNQYFDTRSENIEYSGIPTTYSNIFIKTQLGKILKITDALSAFTTLYSNISVFVSEEFDAI
jgi:hypothetical protein